MKYIIMCGGNYNEWETPRQLIEINGEPLVARTIRLLRKYGVSDIAISSDNSLFEQFDVPVLRHDNYWEVFTYENVKGTWVNAFYPMESPACYLFGDVLFSDTAIKTIVETETTSVNFFASAPPFDEKYIKKYAEPFAFKVVDTKLFNDSIKEVKELENNGKFKRHPIAWELWQVIKKTPLNKIDYTNYNVINDYTCDIDWQKEIEIFENIECVKE